VTNEEQAYTQVRPVMDWLTSDAKGPEGTFFLCRAAHVNQPGLATDCRGPLGKLFPRTEAV